MGFSARDFFYIVIKNVLCKGPGEYFVDGWEEPPITIRMTDELFGQLMKKGADSFYGRDLQEYKLSGDENSLMRVGKFLSPLHEHLNPEGKYAKFLLLTPKKKDPKGVVILLPYLGEKNASWRKKRATDLNRQGYITALPLLPMLDERKPEKQIDGFFRTVADAVVQAVATIAEVNLLLYHLNEKMFPDLPVQIAGFSQGGGFALACGAAAKSGQRFAITAFAPIEGISTLMKSIVSYNIVGYRSFIRAERRKGNTKYKSKAEVKQAITEYLNTKNSDDVLRNHPDTDLCALNIIFGSRDMLAPRREDAKIVEHYQRIAFATNIEKIPGGHAKSKTIAKKQLPRKVETGFKLLDERKMETRELMDKVQDFLERMFGFLTDEKPVLANPRPEADEEREEGEEEKGSQEQEDEEDKESQETEEDSV